MTVGRLPALVDFAAEEVEVPSAFLRTVPAFFRALVFLRVVLFGAADRVELVFFLAVFAAGLPVFGSGSTFGFVFGFVLVVVAALDPDSADLARAALRAAFRAAMRARVRSEADVVLSSFAMVRIRLCGR
ncbi:MAG: hypothetical protein AAF610_06810 [Pseudomonadota bacterium]